MTAPDTDLPDRAATLLRAMTMRGICVIYHDAELAVRLVENVPAGWPPAVAIMAQGDAAIFDPVTAGRVQAAKRAVLDGGDPARLEVMLHSNGGAPAWFELNVEADRPDGGGVRGLFVTAADITEFKSREEALRALLYEVSHRSRNLLAILQSVLGHTARSSNSIAVFERRFRGRIAALAHSQDLITRSNWQGVRFRRLVTSQLADHLGSAAPPELAGEDPLLSPNLALHIGLALHELAANSARFGALATGEGRIAINTELIPAGRRLTWTEDLTRPHPPRPEGGFGRAILEQVVGRAVNGTAEYQVTPHRIAYRLDWPESIAA